MMGCEPRNKIKAAADIFHISCAIELILTVYKIVAL